MADNSEIVVSARKAEKDEVTLTVNGSKLGGWKEIDITLRCEGFPPSFSVSLSSHDPISGTDVAAAGGNLCQVAIGTQTVITGYIDRDSNAGDANNHMLRLVGRGKTQDLVDCSAEYPSGQINSATVLDIASTLCDPYGINVVTEGDPDIGPPVPQANLTYGETGAEIIQRYARSAGLIAYEDSEGQLVLAAVGTETAPSGAVYGENVESYSVQNAVDQLVSQIMCTMNNINVMSDAGDGYFFFHPEDSPLPVRHRVIYLPLEQSVDPQPFTVKKAKWEMSRRIGRSVVVQVTVDSWRDSNGDLWHPNTLVPVDVPGLRLKDKNLCLSEVTFRRNDRSGTTADLTLLPAAAFAPEPINLVPVSAAGVIGPDGKEVQ
ncbi:MAG TPA: hypothetical protein VF503_09305 [Sphingobium sp.]|uniref:phage baseplate assembly protein n=1 Tax=Sphingobium sp. TaxID=1912891 RepID=UPI002ED413DD